jgi:tetratricopeptide (TPR) repeat protein/O-antigen ligase
VFLLVLLVTSFFGIDFIRSFWSTQERMFGIFGWLHVFGLYLILQSTVSSSDTWKRIWYVSFATSIIVVLLGIAQLWEPNLLLNEAVGDRPGSTFGNPTFLAGYLLIHAIAAFYFLFSILSRLSASVRHISFSLLKNREVLFLIFSFLMALVGILNSQTRGDIGGILLGFFVLLIWFSFFPPSFSLSFFSRHALYRGFLVCIIVGFVFFFFTRTASFWQIIPGVSRIADTSFSDVGFLPRQVAWHAAWQGFLAHPVTGVGWENFNVVFNQFYNPAVLVLGYQETRFDKPHNTILEYLVTGGVPLFVAYLAFLLSACYTAIFTRDRLLVGVSLAFWFAYMGRNFFVFETIGLILALVLWLGYLDFRYRQHNARAISVVDSKKSFNQPVPLPALILTALVVFFPVYFLNYLSGVASYYQYYGFTNYVKNKFPQAIASFRSANTIWSPYDWNFKRDYARATAEAYFYNPGRVPQDEAVYAVDQFAATIADHSHDAVTHGLMVDLYNQIYDIHPTLYASLAEEHGRRALALSPNRQEVYFSLSKTRTLQKDYPGALQLLDKALALAPNIPDSHFYYGLVAYANNQPDIGYGHIQQALQLGRVWRNNNEARIVANFFADSGRVNEAIDLYRKAIELKKDDFDARLKLGVALFQNGDREHSREVLSALLRDFDISSSPSYSEIVPVLQSLGL